MKHAVRNCGKAPKKIIIAAVSGMISLSLAAGIILRPKANDAPDIIWREYPVERRDITASLDGAGKLEFAEVSHSFEISLKVEEIFVETGQEVKKGDMLAQYSKEDIEKKIEERKGALETAERSLQDAQNAQQAEKLQNSLADTQSRQNAQNAYDNSKRGYDSSIQELEQRAGQLQKTVDSLKQAVNDAEQTGSTDTSQLQAELTRLEKELDELEAKSKDTSALIQEKKTQIADIEARIGSASENPDDDADFLAAELTRLQGELAELEAQSEEVSALIPEKQSRIADIQAQISGASEKESQLAEQKSQLSQAQSELDAVNRDLATQKAALSNLNDDYERQNEQNAQSEAVQNQIDALNNVSRNNAIKNAQAEVEKARESLRETEALLDTPALTAQTDGIVTKINCMPGEEVSAGKSIITIGNSEKKQVIIFVPQEDIASVKVGQKVELLFSAAPENVINGTVSKKSLLPAEGGSGVSYEVIISLEKDQPDLLEGMTCNVSFILKRVENVLALANKAITMRDGKQYVTVRLPDGSHEEREIKTGFSDGRVSEIISGLCDGDIVVVEG